MLIDWFTVAAQALNFVVLVWLLQRFLYKPILRAIDSREARIAAEVAAAAARMTEANQVRDEFRSKSDELDRQHAAHLLKATQDAQAEGKRLLDEARRAADALSARRLEQLRADAGILNRSIRETTQQEVFAIARRALSDLAGVDLERRACDVFVARLGTLGGDSKVDLDRALKSAEEPALVRSAFDLPAQQRESLRVALNQACAADLHLRFETAPELVSGIELTAGGQKLSWSIAGYLESMQKGIDALVSPKVTPAAKIAAPNT